MECIENIYYVNISTYALLFQIRRGKYLNVYFVPLFYYTCIIWELLIPITPSSDVYGVWTPTFHRCITKPLTKPVTQTLRIPHTDTPNLKTGQFPLQYVFCMKHIIYTTQHVLHVIHIYTPHTFTCYTLCMSHTFTRHIHLHATHSTCHTHLHATYIYILCMPLL